MNDGLFFLWSEVFISNRSISWIEFITRLGIYEKKNMAYINQERAATQQGTDLYCIGCWGGGVFCAPPDCFSIVSNFVFVASLYLSIRAVYACATCTLEMGRTDGNMSNSLFDLKCNEERTRAKFQIPKCPRTGRVFRHERRFRQLSIFIEEISTRCGGALYTR